MGQYIQTPILNKENISVSCLSQSDLDGVRHSLAFLKDRKVNF
jgi:hypothetical protein